MADTISASLLSLQLLDRGLEAGIFAGFAKEHEAFKQLGPSRSNYAGALARPHQK